MKKIKDKLKILDLFSGTQSVKKALEPIFKIDYKGIDIIDPKKNLTMDLSQKNILKKIIKLLDNWIPDFVWASPPCRCFSRTSCITGGTLPFIIKNNVIRLRKDNEFEMITHNNYKNLKHNENWRNDRIADGKKALKMFKNTRTILQYYNVPFVIENPAHAYSSILLEKYYVKNIAYYCNYGFNYKKPTGIYAYKEFDFEKCNHKKHSGSVDDLGNNKKRSVVPKKLIQEIIFNYFKI